MTDAVSTSRLLATIHSGIPSTDDDGPLFNELHKLVAEEESQSQQGQGHGQLEDAPVPLRFEGSSRQHYEEGNGKDVNLNQVSGTMHF